MREYKGYNIPEMSDLKKDGVVIPMGASLMVKLSDNILFDVGLDPTKVYDMPVKEFNDLIYGRATGYIDTILRTEE